MITSANMSHSGPRAGLYEEDEEQVLDNCAHCRARSYSSGMMEVGSSGSSSNGHTGVHGRERASSEETDTDTGYFSFGSIGLMEPQEEDSRDYTVGVQYKVRHHI